MIYFVTITPELHVHIIQVAYSSLIWINECPVASYVVYNYGGLDVELRRYIKEYVASVHQRPHTTFGLYCGDNIASEGTYSFEDVLHQFFCILRQVLNLNAHSNTVFALSRRQTYIRQTPFGKQEYG